MLLDMEIDKPEQARLLAMSPDTLRLSVRSHNCLEKAGIKTIGDLVSKSERELLSIKNFGQTSLKEICKKLNALNLKLDMAVSGNGQITETRSRPIGNHSRLLDIPIERMALTVRSFNALHKAGIYTAGGILEKSDIELLKIKNFGRKCLQEIKDKLSSLGLSHDHTLKIDHEVLTEDLQIKNEFIHAIPPN